MPLKINGATSGSITLAAPATGSDVSLTLPGSVGTSGQLLSTDGAGVLSFVNGGKILQVVRATDSTSRSTTSTSYADVTGMSITITPLATTSTILVIATGPVNAFWTSDGASEYGYLQITDSSNAALSGAEAMEIGLGNISGVNTRQIFTSYTIIGRSAPNTTSAVTYKLRFRSESAGTTFRLRNDATTGQMYAFEVAA